MFSIINLESWLAEEAAIVQKAPGDREVYMHEWLQKLDEYLNSSQVTKEELKKCQKKVSDILLKQVRCSCTPATRQQISKCMASFYSKDTSGLFNAVGKCVEIVKSRDDTVQFLTIKLTAIACLGEVFEKAGRMVGTLFPDTQQSLSRFMRTAEAEAKCEVLQCYEKMLIGLSSAASSGFKDIFKTCKTCLGLKSYGVRCAAAKCALELSKHASFLYTTELDTMASYCIRALEGSNYDVRVCIAELLGSLLASSQKPEAAKTKRVALEEIFNIMSAAFLRGGVGFLKGGSGELLKSGTSQDVRVGVTQAYVILFREMGTVWLQKYLPAVIIHVLELVASPKAISSHIEAVYSRKCVSFVLQAVLFGMLPEPGQVQALKELCKIISKQMDIIHHIVTNEPSSDAASSLDVINTQHVLVCALNGVASLALNLSSSVEVLLSEKVVNAVLSVLIHPAPAAWLSAAWCMRCCALAMPRMLTGFMDACVKKMRTLKSSRDALTGYGHTLAAMIGGLHQCPLGIPYKKATALLNLAEELLQNVPTQSGKLAQSKIQTGWALIGALMTLVCLAYQELRTPLLGLANIEPISDNIKFIHLMRAKSEPLIFALAKVLKEAYGPSYTRSSLPRLVQLWLECFPQNSKDIEMDKSKGNVMIWLQTIENRAGALSSIGSFIKNCAVLLTNDVMKRIIYCMETASSMLQPLCVVLKIYGSQLKPVITMFKLRLYKTLILLPPKLLEASFTSLLRETVAEFTLADHKGATTTSMLQSLCHKDDSILLGAWVQDTDHRKVEEQLQTNSASGSGALEHDHLCVYARLASDEDLPGPLPLGVAVIDASIDLFGQIFPFIVNKHRGQLMDHFNDCISKSKGPRQQAIQVNLFTAFLAALKNIADVKAPFGDESLRNSANTLVQEALMNAEPTLRCAGGEALGRMVQVVNDPSFVAQMALLSFEKAKAARDGIPRSGHSLALGCLHRYVGGMGSGKHLNNSVAILLALAKDESSLVVQVWALHALTLIADSGGPMFRQCVEPTLSVVLELILKNPSSSTEVHQCLGKCMGALITSIGPELQDTSKNMQRLRMFCMTACSVMQNHPDALVRSEAIYCLQQLHVFAPNFLNLSLFIPQICKTLFSKHLLLRRASVACLRQLAQREAKEVCEHGLLEVKRWVHIKKKMFVGEESLEGVLFTLFDSEVDPRLKADIKESIVSLLQILCSENLGHWLSMCRQVLLASKAETDKMTGKKGAKDKGEDQEDEDEDRGLNLNEKPQDKSTITPKWKTRVFAMECIRMIIDTCKQAPMHLDLALAREKEQNSGKKGEFLVMHLAELVRLAFIAGTSNNDQLKLAGIKTLFDVVHLFAKSEDPDIPGHVILEQYQAQVGTALKPAFTPSTPPDIIAMACEVCSEWIGTGISGDINDVRRIQQMLATSLSKISSQDMRTDQIYNESAYTLESLAVLKAWAKIYIMAMKHESASTKQSNGDVEGQTPSGRLLDLVEKDLRLLAKYWFGALLDYTYLMLPKQYHSQLPKGGGTFYRNETIDEVRPHYRNSWSSIAYAATLWLTNYGFPSPQDTMLGAADEMPPAATSDSSITFDSPKSPEDINNDRYHMLSGICVEALCSQIVSYSDEDICYFLMSIKALLETDLGRRRLTHEKALSTELLVVVYRHLMTRDHPEMERVLLNVVEQVCKATLERIARAKSDENEDDQTENEITQGRSVVFSILEISLYVVSKYASEMIPAASRKPNLHTAKKSYKGPFCGPSELLSQVALLLSDTPNICSPSASVECLPSVLYLLNGVVKYHCKIDRAVDAGERESFQKTMLSIKKILSSKFLESEEVKANWTKLTRGSLVSLMDAFENSGITEVELDKEKMLVVLSLFILSGKTEIMEPISVVEKLVQIFNKIISDEDYRLKINAVRILCSIVKSTDSCISHQFINGCVPSIVAKIESLTTVNSELELNYCNESFSLLEILVAMAPENSRTNMMVILIQSLIHTFVDDSTLNKVSKFSRLLHENALQRVKSVGPLYPLPFKSAIEKSPGLKVRLETALKADQEKQKRLTAAKALASNSAQPKIQLKMNFSNFK